MSDLTYDHAAGHRHSTEDEATACFRKREAAAPATEALRAALEFLGSDDVLADGSVWTMDEIAERLAAALASPEPTGFYDDPDAAGNER